MSWKEMPFAYKFAILLVVMAVASLISTGDLIISGVLLVIALLAYVAYSAMKKSDEES